MPKKNQIKFRDFQKAIGKFLELNFPNRYAIIQKKGSGIRYELFKNENDTDPSKMWVVHKDDFVHKGDLDQTCDHLGISWQELMSLI